jgi:hypothetical protein
MVAKRIHEFAEKKIVVQPEEGQEKETDEYFQGAARYAQFLQANVEALGEEIEMAYRMKTRIGPAISEKEFLNGSYFNHRRFQDFHVEGLLVSLLSKISNTKNLMAHVDLGGSLLPYYAAYFLTLYQVPLTVAYHVPPEGQNFSIGGASDFAKVLPGLRRRLVNEIHRHANLVFVENLDVARYLNVIFSENLPKLQVDPFFGEPDNLESEILPS